MLLQVFRIWKNVQVNEPRFSPLSKTLSHRSLLRTFASQVSTPELVGVNTIESFSCLKSVLDTCTNCFKLCIGPNCKTVLQDSKP